MFNSYLRELKAGRQWRTHLQPHLQILYHHQHHYSLAACRHVNLENDWHWNVGGWNSSEYPFDLSTHLVSAQETCSIIRNGARVAVLNPSWSTIRHGLPQDNDAEWWAAGCFGRVLLCPSCQFPLFGKEVKSRQLNGRLASVKTADTGEGIQKVYWY